MGESSIVLHCRYTQINDMKTNTLRIAISILLVPLYASAQERLPIIDMHLHALPADWAGPPPLATCQAFFPFLLPWDPSAPYQDTFVAMHREPPCDDPVWSPKTDEQITEMHGDR
jgi:uncharacterized protein